MAVSPTGWDACGVVAERTGAAEALFRVHYAALAGWCRRMVGDDEVAHDIAAEAFVRLLGRWTAVADPRAYLYTTALNLIRDRWRRGERERAALRRLPIGTSEQPAPATELRLLIESLPRRLQQVVVLHYFADLPVAAVAASLGVAPGTVKRDLYDARAKLHALLEPR
ncbi:MAG TPA: sigma-70 family RNA polymerase sigma factor [Mycobacteriales bacterium]|nr:sigma-70 family RNA polymerase sigma factor [Mycobacteriales bacterium]